MEGSQYCVLWNNYHGSLVDTIGALQKDGHLIDVTVVCSEGGKISAHQLVLAACSTFFRDFIMDNPSKHPIVLLPSEIRYPELKAMIEFMYTGQVCIQQERLQAFIRGAKYLRIKGLEDSEESEVEELGISESEKSKEPDGKIKRSRTTSVKDEIIETNENDLESVPRAMIKGKKVRDHRYTQQVDIGDSDENREQWEMVDRKPIIFQKSDISSSGHRKRRRRGPSLRKVPVHLSNSIVCYERQEREDIFTIDDPINKVRRPGHRRNETVDLCTCTARKIWSVQDTEALLKAWKETLLQVPPSYFIRSMSLCRRVAKRLQQRGVQKNWRQCQVKMKNLRREVRLFKKSDGKSSSKRPSEVANACEKLLTTIEDIFNKEEEIRHEWYEKKGGRLKDDERIGADAANSNDILAQVASLADSDICDDDTDVAPIETEGEGGAYTEGEDCVDSYVNSHEGGPHHRMHTGPDGTVVHHIVEDISMHSVAKDEPHSATDTDM